VRLKGQQYTNEIKEGEFVLVRGATGRTCSGPRSASKLASARSRARCRRHRQLFEGPKPIDGGDYIPTTTLQIDLDRWSAEPRVVGSEMPAGAARCRDDCRRLLSGCLCGNDRKRRGSAVRRANASKANDGSALGGCCGELEVVRPAVPPRHLARSPPTAGQSITHTSITILRSPSSDHKGSSVGPSPSARWRDPATRLRRSGELTASRPRGALLCQKPAGSFQPHPTTGLRPNLPAGTPRARQGVEGRSDRVTRVRRRPDSREKPVGTGIAGERGIGTR